MLWILLVLGVMIAVGGCVVIIFDFLNCPYDIREDAIKTVIALGIGAVGLLGLLGVDSLSYDEVTQTDEGELVAISEGEILTLLDDEGKVSVVLQDSEDLYNVAYNETDNCYSFCYNNKDGMAVGVKADKDVVTFCETDDCTPYVVEYTTYTKNKMNEVLRIILAFGFGESNQKSYEIYTPAETIFGD